METKFHTEQGTEPSYVIFPISRCRCGRLKHGKYGHRESGRPGTPRKEADRIRKVEGYAYGSICFDEQTAKVCIVP